MRQTMARISMPRIFLFGGPNGAGKTTIALQLLPALGCKSFVNADSIAAGLSPLNADAVALQAGVLMMKRLRELREQRIDFGTESTLAARAYVPFIRDCQSRGYTFHLIYVWLPAPEMAIERVAFRVRAGGHAIPIETIRRRYEAGRCNFSALYRPLADEWTVFCNVNPTLQVVAEGGRDSQTLVHNAAMWQDINR